MSNFNFGQSEVVEMNYLEMSEIDGGERSARTWAIEIGVGILFGAVGIIAFEVGYSN